MSTWRPSAVITISAVVLLAVSAIWLNGTDTGTEKRADLISSSIGDPSSSVALRSPQEPLAALQSAVADSPKTPLDPPTAESADEPPVATPPAPPTGLTIPSLGVESPVVPVGLEPDGSMQIPGAQEAGWYLPGRIPGSPTGSAVIAAHVDFNDQPGVFFELRTIELGAEIEVTDALGETHRFTVTERFQVNKDDLPTSELFRTGGDPILSLVTCGGAFDPSARSYEDNIVVRAEPLDS